MHGQFCGSRLSLLAEFFQPPHQLHGSFIKNFPIEWLDQNEEFLDVKGERLSVPKEDLSLLLEFRARLDNALGELLGDLDLVRLTDVCAGIFKSLVVRMHRLGFPQRE